MTVSKVKVKVTEVWNVRKWPISKAISSANMHEIQIPIGLQWIMQTNFASYE